MGNFGFDIVSTVPTPVKLLGGLALLLFAVWFAYGMLRGPNSDE